MALWSGRFQEEADEFAQEFGASLPVDVQMYAQDIQGSRAHADMLAKAGIISEQDAADIARGLDEIEKQLDEETFEFKPEDEDIHMAIERALTALVGDAGARLHTGRSRNDQVATDARLAAKDLCAYLADGNVQLRDVLLEVAQNNQDAILSGCTHLQHAQPVRFAHHLLAYFWMLERDYKRISAAFNAADVSPLGAAALAGTTYPLDRQATANAMEFSSVIPNSMDAVSDRDFLLDLEYSLVERRIWLHHAFRCVFNGFVH